MILLDLAREEREIKTGNIGGTCILKNNSNCWPLSGTSYNATCCSPDHQCGILQGGCLRDDDCMNNLVCSKHGCGPKNSGMQCCQIPGREQS